MSTYNTKLGEFCATHKNWCVELAGDPYNLKIKFEDGFVIFNYNQLSSDFNNEIVREARGIIFREGEWEYPVCHAFDKFGNYGESYVPDIDWSSIVVSEKIDGSIMKLWCYNGCWHLSTNANIDAANATIGDVRRDNFAQVFWEVIKKHLRVHEADIVDWFNTLNIEYTYIFELVSPYTRVVIPYEKAEVYFLGARNNISNQQFGCDTHSAMHLNVEFLPRPKLYPMHSIDDITKAANALPWDSEGYVCYDKDFNRCKIKSPKYVMAHFARNNNVITRWHLIDIILRGEMDEFIIYASDYKDQIEWTNSMMSAYIASMDGIGEFARGLRQLEKKRAAEVIKNFDKLAQPIMFLNYDRDVSGEEYVSGWDTYRWDRVLEQYIIFKGGKK